MSDMVNNPQHYTAGGIETIVYIEAKLSPEEYRGYLKGQVMKYISRAGKKHDEAEDLGKAAWYLERLRRLVGEQRGEVRGPEGQSGPDRAGSRSVPGDAESPPFIHVADLIPGWLSGDTTDDHK